MEKLDNGFKRNNEEFTSKTSHLNGVIADLNARVKSLEEEVLEGDDLERDPTGSGLNTRTSRFMQSGHLKNLIKKKQS